MVVKVRITVIMARKSQGDTRIVSIGDTGVLGPAECAGTGCTGSSGDAASGPMAVGTVEAGMRGSSVGTTSGGWSSTGSQSGRGGAP